VSLHQISRTLFNLILVKSSEAIQNGRCRSAEHKQ